jgi:hypothetical protein
VCGAAAIIAHAALIVVGAPLAELPPTTTAVMERVLDEGDRQLQGNLLQPLFRQRVR